MRIGAGMTGTDRRTRTSRRRPRPQDRWRGAAAFGLSALVAVGAALVPAAPALAAAGDPFDPSVPTVFIGQQSPTQLYTAVQGAGAVTFEPTGPVADRTYNAIGFNSLDNYLYGLRVESGNKTSLQRVGQDGQVTGLGSVTGLPTPAENDAYNQGSFGAGATAGTLYVRNQLDANSMWAINVGSLPAAGAASATRIALSGAGVPNVSDITWKDGFLWGMYNNDRMYRINPVNGQVSSWVTGLGITGDFGAQWQYGNGNLGLSRNVDGRVFQIAIDLPGSATPGFRLVSSTSGPASSNNDGASIPGLPVDLGLTKTGPDEYTPGGTITYTLTVTNNGPGASSGSVVTDQIPASVTSVSSPTPGCDVDGNALSCTLGELAPSESTTLTVTGTVAAGTTGELTNTASVTGNEQDPTPGNNTDSWTVSPVIVPAPALALVKSNDAGEEAISVGQIITYTFLVTNTGNVAVADLRIDETAFTGAGALGAVSCPATSLTPGASTTCTADYTVEQGDVDAGSIENTATAAGTTPGGEVASDPSSTVAPSASNPAVSLVKSADSAGPVALGASINYSFLVTNTGNVTLQGVAVDDPRLAGVGVSVSCPVASLVPGASTNCVADDPYVVTESDVLAGEVVNTATAGAAGPGGAPVSSAPSTSTLPTVAAAPALAMVKSAELADGDGDGSMDVGETILFSFSVTNTGNVTLAGVLIGDPFLQDLGIGVTCEAEALAPGATALCVADESYVVTQTDIDAGEVVNVATATGTPPAGEPVESAPSTTVTTGAATPGIRGVKSADLRDANGNGRADAGEEIVFTITVTNTGDITLSEVTVDDRMVDVVCPTGALAPGNTVDCVSSAYRVTAADVTAGEVRNVATVAGETPGAQSVSASTNVTRTPAGPVPSSPSTDPLANTGAEVPAFWTAAVVLLGIGVVLFLVGRRRRSNIEH